MKKIFLILAIALGMSAMQSCKCNADTDVEAVEFVYDVLGTAKGNGSYAIDWTKGANTGVFSVDGEATISVKATNDTNNVKVLTEASCFNAPKLSDALVSNDVDVSTAAAEAKALLTDNIKLTGLKGSVELALFGYVKYGPFFFNVDEQWQYPPVDTTAVYAPTDTVLAEFDVE